MPRCPLHHARYLVYLKTSPPGLLWNNLAKDVGALCPEWNILQAGLEGWFRGPRDRPGFQLPAGLPEGLSEELTAPWEGSAPWKGQKGWQLQALKLISVFLSPCCLGPGSFQTSLR